MVPTTTTTTRLPVLTTFTPSHTLMPGLHHMEQTNRDHFMKHNHDRPPLWPKLYRATIEVPLRHQVLATPQP